MAEASAPKHAKPEEIDRYTHKKLGFLLRLCQLGWFFELFLIITVMGFFTKTVFNPLDPEALGVFVKAIISGISIWLVNTHKKVAIPWVIATEAIDIVYSLYTAIVPGPFVLKDYLIGEAFTIFVMLYFAFSPHVHKVLDQPFNAQTRAALIKKHDAFFAPKTWPFWRNLIAYFCIFSVVGHWMEAGFCLLIKWGLVQGTYDPNSQIWSDWLYPFCIYGVGVCFCVLVFYPVKMFLMKRVKSIPLCVILSFLVNAFVCGVIEFVMGMVMNQPVNGHFPLWDYSNMPFNLMGQICLQNTALFGVVATLITWVVYPTMERINAQFPRDVNNAIFVAVVLVFLILFFLYCQNLMLPGGDHMDAQGRLVDAAGSVIKTGSGV